MTPMLSQYLELKAKYPDTILFFRLGDFYEMFFQDALTAAPILEVQLTSRDRNSENPVPMCGVPFHAVSNYIQKLIAAGLKVAICEQMEIAGAGKGIVRRDVVRVVTPALVADPDLVAPDQENRLLCVESKNHLLEVAVLDLLKSEVRVGAVREEHWEGLLEQYRPNEILCAGELPSSVKCTVTLRPDYFKEGVITALKLYLKETQKIDSLPFLDLPLPLNSSHFMKVDAVALSALEVLPHAEDPERVSLFHVLNRTNTAMGRRRLKEWLLHPLLDRIEIERRQSMVESLRKNSELLGNLEKILKGFLDLERLASKVQMGLANPRDLYAILSIQQQIPNLKSLFDSPLTQGLALLSDLTDRLRAALLEELPLTYKEGGIIQSNYHPEVAELRSLTLSAKEHIAKMEMEERDRTGISTLKIKFSRVFGYTIEITKSHLTKVPSGYIRKQTIANGERFITEALKVLEEKILSAETRLNRLEERLFLELRVEAEVHAAELLSNARMLSELDCLCSLARVALEKNFVRPEIHEGYELVIEQGRHPSVESLLPPGKFVPNSCSFDFENCRTWIITGPNMGGKSTVMRQIALITLMAHMGAFVPASFARIPLTDAIFTRIGASDDLGSGRSTFMVEMSEVSNILSSATTRSLILIDEIGRGTSTYDGLSLAWSILEHLHEQIRAKVLFATHFHEITTLEKSLVGTKNVSLGVKQVGDRLLFLHQVVSGAANRSYGVHVAKLAGLPSPLLKKAGKILEHLEGKARRPQSPTPAASEHDQLPLLW